MTKNTTKPSRQARWERSRFTIDAAMGAFGCCLAAASASFGIYMNVHGPAPSLGTSRDFSVFAQLAPRSMPLAAVGKQGTPKASGELDMTATASIRRRVRETAENPEEKAIISSVILEAADAQAATIAIDGQLRTVRVGDTVPGAGDVLAILPGPRPVLKTSRGLILSARR